MASALDTPMMRQYLAIKADHPDAIVFYRMGDFYEMFLEDAERVAPLLDIALTTRDKGKADAVPMCGVPTHSAEGYIRQLAAQGLKVAICEQVEDPKQAGGRRLVKREVVEVVTPGLVGDPSGIEGGQEVSIAAIHVKDPAEPVGLAVLDASTGDFRRTSVAQECGGGVPRLLLEEIERIAPREVLVSSMLAQQLASAFALRLPDAVITVVENERFAPGAAPTVPDGFDASDEGADSAAAAALLDYLGQNQPFALRHTPRLRRYELTDTVVLDAATRSHLELFENSEDRGRKGTLLALLDRSRTALGARRLARWIGYPLRSAAAVRARQDAVTFFAEADRMRTRLRDALGEVRDLERILAKAIRPGAVPRDLGVLRGSLLALPGVVEALRAEDLFAELGTAAAERPALVRIPEPLPELANLLCEALVDDPPVIAKGSRGANETGYIREGFSGELDGIHEAARKGREWIAGLEAEERVATGIATLKVRYHPVHGYSLEVSKAQLEKVPDHYTRKQTLASVERFTTESLSEIEGQVMGANERAAALEREIFAGLRESVVEAAPAIRAAAEVISDLDALAALADVARMEGWVRPVVDEDELIEIFAGRHPVVEKSLRSAGGDGYVPNDTRLDCAGPQIMLLTGPNMSGKSTYLRQVALIVLMAQIGSFVPADRARIGVVDRIFTRVGASDRLARGESTFMVEMRETAEILRLASRRSLIILDEIGRGTSTFDGLSIAWAVAEYLHDTPGLEARTLFATHYHELIELAAQKARLVNAHFEVREWKDEVVFLRRLLEGGASRSYGIQVAQLAGLPERVVARAREILGELEDGGTEGRGPAETRRGDGGQLSLALGGERSRREAEVLAELGRVDPLNTTPMQALELLLALRGRLEEER